MTIHRFFVSDFVDIQRKSFSKLLEKGLIEEFSKRNPITNTKKNLELFFYPHYYKLTPPQYTPRESILRSKSYSSKLYLPVQLTDKNTQIIKLKWVYIGNLPLMTKRGHFILNGISRVIVNQMIRSPGIYFQTKIYDNYITKWSNKTETTYKRHYADLICQRGAWLRLEIDKEKLLWAQLKKGPKIPVFWLLISMGLTEKIIFKSVMDSKRLLLNFYPQLKKTMGFSTAPRKKNRNNYPYLKSPSAVWSKIYNLFFPGTKAKLKRKNPLLSSKNRNKNFFLSGDFFFKTNEAKTLPTTLFSVKNQHLLMTYPPISLSPKVLTKNNRPFLFFNSFASKMKLSITKGDKKTAIDYRKKPTKRLLNKKEKLYFSTSYVDPKNIFSITLPLKTGDKKKKTFGDLSPVLIQKGKVLSSKKSDINSLTLARFGKNRNKKQIKTISELGRKWIFNKFMNPRTYDLGKQGRISINKKFGLSLNHAQCTLTPQDLLFATDYLLKVERGLKTIDDIDNLKNRRVRTSGELLQIQLGTGLVRLEKIIRDKMNQRSNQFSFNTHIKEKSAKKLKEKNKKLTINELINTKAFNGVMQEFFGSSPLSQFMDQINPLSELTHKRRLSSMGPGGVTRDNATLAIRGIHPTHYGRICPVETPEGKNTGLVNSITTYSRINIHGLIETPFYKVYKGQVQKKTGMFFFSAEQEEKIKLAAADLYVSKIGFLPKSNIPVRIAEEFTKISRNVVQYIGVSPVQMISIATSLIPFLEHDDANRALMGSNMQRQAVPLIRPERPLVGTGLEARVISDSGHGVQANSSGFISYVSAQKIIVLCPLNGGLGLGVGCPT